MAKINANDTIQNMVKELQLDVALETPPSQLMPNVQAVYNLNDKTLIDSVTLAVALSGDTTITVPNNEFWEVVHLHVQFLTTATATNRSLRALITENGSTVAEFQSDGTQAPSVNRAYEFRPNVSTDQNTSGTIQYPPFLKWLKSGWIITFTDRSGVDDSDSITVFLQIRRHKI